MSAFSIYFARDICYNRGKMKDAAASDPAAFIKNGALLFAVRTEGE
jgi:hypothetical protein